METSRARIINKAIETIRSSPNGIRYSDLHGKIREAFPDIPANTIHGTIWNLETRTDEVYRPARGFFRHTNFKDLVDEKKETVEIRGIKEEDFYQSFADWIVNELEECTKAVSLGGNKFKDKWGTPDVIGVREPRKSDIIRPPTEVVSAEIKTDATGLIVAFGQACSYKLFSHKSYIVIPKNSSEDDIARVDGLSRIFGIGLILFDNRNTKNPDFEIRVRASRHEPDMFYVNKYMKLVEDELFS